MIKALYIKDPDNGPVKWWPDVEALSKREVIHFEPGINLIWGPNGVGKSTLLSALARLSHCEQGGRSTITRSSVDSFFEIADMKKIRDGMRLEFDAHSVRMFDSSKTIGLRHGAFDDDFFSLGLSGLKLQRASRGQGTIAKLNQVMEPAENVVWAMTRDHVNTLWRKRLDFIEEHCWTADIEPGPSTILMDEPDMSLDWPNKEMLWASIERSSAQLIIATHSLFALCLPANIISLGPPKYLEECREIARRVLARVEQRSTRTTSKRARRGIERKETWD
jgi:predicted ATPase